MGNKLGGFRKHRIFLGSLDESSPEGKFIQVVSSILTYKAFETLFQVQEQYIYSHTSTPFRPPPSEILIIHLALSISGIWRFCKPRRRSTTKDITPD